MTAAPGQSRRETLPHLVRHGLLFGMWMVVITNVFARPGAWIEEKLGVEYLGLVFGFLAFFVAAYIAASGYLSKFPVTVKLAQNRLARLYAAVGVAIWSLIGVGVLVSAVVMRVRIEPTEWLPFLLLLVGVLPVYWLLAKAAIRFSETQAEVTAKYDLDRGRT